MSEPQTQRMPDKGGPLPHHNTKPPFPLTDEERYWWRWLLRNLDKQFFGQKDVLAIAMLAREIQEVIDSGAAWPPRLYLHLETFGLMPHGRKKMIIRTDPEGAAAKPKPVDPRDDFSEFD